MFALLLGPAHFWTSHWGFLWKSKGYCHFGNLKCYQLLSCGVCHILCETKTGLSENTVPYGTPKSTVIPIVAWNSLKRCILRFHHVKPKICPLPKHPWRCRSPHPSCSLPLPGSTSCLASAQGLPSGTAWPRRGGLVTWWFQTLMQKYMLCQYVDSTGSPLLCIL